MEQSLDENVLFPAHVLDFPLGEGTPFDRVGTSPIPQSGSPPLTLITPPNPSTGPLAKTSPTAPTRKDGTSIGSDWQSDDAKNPAAKKNLEDSNKKKEECKEEETQRQATTKVKKKNKKKGGKVKRLKPENNNRQTIPSSSEDQRDAAPATLTTPEAIMAGRNKIATLETELSKAKRELTTLGFDHIDDSSSSFPKKTALFTHPVPIFSTAAYSFMQAAATSLQAGQFEKLMTPLQAFPAVAAMLLLPRCWSSTSSPHGEPLTNAVLLAQIIPLVVEVYLHIESLATSYDPGRVSSHYESATDQYMKLAATCLLFLALSSCLVSKDPRLPAVLSVLAGGLTIIHASMSLKKDHSRTEVIGSGVCVLLGGSALFTPAATICYNNKKTNPQATDDLKDPLLPT